MKFAVAALVGSVSAYTAMEAVEYQFIDFVAKHGKSYGTKAEYEFRLEQFKSWAAEVEELNRTQTTSVHGINKFADLTHNERKKMLTGFVPQAHNGPYKTFSHNGAQNVDWRDQGAVTAVKDQGQCGSCWAFSTTGAIESAEFIKGHGLTPLSEQQLVDCSKVINKGCNGGSMPVAMMYAAKHQLMTEADYPYTAKDGSCQYDETKTVTHVAGKDAVTPDDVAQYEGALQAQPLSIAIEADKVYFQSYTSGILTDATKCGKQLDHGVLAVGYGTDDNGVDYAIVKNSWGPSWGDQGYVKIELTNDTCGLMDQPTVPEDN